GEDAEGSKDAGKLAGDKTRWSQKSRREREGRHTGKKPAASTAPLLLVVGCVVVAETKKQRDKRRKNRAEVAVAILAPSWLSSFWLPRSLLRSLSHLP
ncbi:hypothetical protein GW17_00059490, partial [Ensete ventricosum]